MCSETYEYWLKKGYLKHMSIWCWYKYVKQVRNLTILAQVTVFEKEADWMNKDDLDFIIHIAVHRTLSSGYEVIICNGRTQDLLFYRFVKQNL